MTEQIRIALVKRANMTEAALARRLGTSPQNLHNKLARDNFTESDLRAIAEALDCDLEVKFRLRDTGEYI